MDPTTPKLSPFDPFRRSLQSYDGWQRDIAHWTKIMNGNDSDAAKAKIEKPTTAGNQMVYAGRLLCGSITKAAGEWRAYDQRGHKVGTFSTAQEASRAVLIRFGANAGVASR